MFTRTSRAKRRIGAAVLAALVGSLLAFASPAVATATAEATSERFAGANRYDTAAKIALDANWDAAGGNGEVAVVVVNGDNFPDGLAAGALGNRILLTKKDSIPAETAAAIAALECKTCTTPGPGIASLTVIGGTGVISSATMESLGNAAGVTASRLAGADRYATALAVADAVDGAAAPGNIVLATGENFPDALAAGPLALKLNAPIVLTTGSSLRADVKAYIATMTATGTVTIVGGTAAVPESIVTEIQSMGKNVTRLAGTDREATAVAVAGALGTTGNHSVILVNRGGFADALAAAPFAHQADVEGAILLVSANAIPTATANWHVSQCGELGKATTGTAAGQVYVAGGTAVVSSAVETDAKAATKCVPLSASATATTSAATLAQIPVQTTGNGWSATAGPILTAVPGSAAAGLAGNDWNVVMAVATAGAGDSASITGANTLTVKFDQNAGAALTMTQQQYVARFNAIPEAAALFTAAARGATASGDATHDKIVPNVKTAATRVKSTVSHTVTVTFSAPVGGIGNHNKLPKYADFVAAGGAWKTNVTTVPGWIEDAAATGGQSVYVITYNGSTAPLVATDSITIATGKVSTVGSVNSTADLTAIIK